VLYFVSLYALANNWDIWNKIIINWDCGCS